MSTPRELLKEGAAALGVALEEEILSQFDRYAALLTEWNQRMNLTAITDPAEIAVKHFVDSLALLSAVKLEEGARMIDVGTGAGFPGVPVKLARPDCSLTLLDSLQKRLTFLDALKRALPFEAALIHVRAEEGGRDPALRERFDLATARAVAPMHLLAECCLPYVKVGGVFAALKGPQGEEELAEGKKAITLLGGEAERVCPFTLPDGGQRRILVIRKVRPTPAAYPRHGGKMKKSPLLS